MDRRLPTALIVSIALLAGCRSHQLRHDQEKFRAALLEMETNQIMDNLVRAHCGYPIVHIDYGSISGTVTDSVNGSLNASHNGLSLSGFTNLIGGAIGGSQNSQLAVSGEPVRDDPSVYLAYLKFLDLDGSLVATAFPPPQGAAHIMTCCDGVYYWVPIQYRGAFFELSMRVTGMRSQPASAPTFTPLHVVGATVLRPKEIPDHKIEAGTKCRIEIEFLETIPSDSGVADVTIHDSFYSLPIRPAGNVGLGAGTNKLHVDYVYGENAEDGELLALPNELALRLRGKTIDFYPARFPPKVETSDETLRRLGTELNQIRLNQLRTMQ